MQVCAMSNLIYTDQQAERSKNNNQPSTSGRYDVERVPDDADQGPFLVVIALIVFFAVLIGFFATAANAAEADSVPVTPIAEAVPVPVTPVADTVTPPATPAVEAVPAAEPKSPPTDWKPPVAKVVPAPSPIDAEQKKKIIEEWGVEIISLNLTAAGYMIDFRYRVLDVEKSKIFFDSRIKPYLHVEKSNAKLPVPMAAKVGAFRPTNRGKNIKPNKIYYMVFGNPDAHVKSGEKVTMVIGDFKAEHMTVN